MGQIHADTSWLVVGVTAVFTVIAAVCARIGPRPWIDWALRAVAAVVGLQVLLGLLAYASGSRPRTGLHLLYAVAALVVLPLAKRFSSEAPPAPRAAVLAIGGVLMLMIVWRLFATGG
jgi:hypothetical protein